MPGFTVYRRDRLSGGGGGLAPLICNWLRSTTLSLQAYESGVLETLAVRVALGTQWCNILLIYNPGRSVTQSEFTYYVGQLRGSTLVIGDFNTRHQSWEPSISLGSTNPTGRALFQTLLASPLSLLTPPGLETRVDPYTGRVSTLGVGVGILLQLLLL